MGGCLSILLHGTDRQLAAWSGDPQDLTTCLDANFRFMIHTFGELIEAYGPFVAWAPTEDSVRAGDRREGTKPNTHQDREQQNIGRSIARRAFPESPNRDDLATYLHFPGSDAFTPEERDRIASAYVQTIALCDATSLGRLYTTSDMKRGGWFQRPNKAPLRKPMPSAS